ncbi:signal peptidase I [Eubacterium ruminantium]|nr:signal peptidase I [Eubacterium ruminantium]
MKKKRSFLRKLISAFEWILLILGVVFLVQIFITTSKGKAVNIFGKSLLHVITGSMEPTISVDDYIIVEEADIGSLTEGDIIAYYSRNPEVYGKIVIHRIIGINEDGSFITMGDANPIPDSIPVKADEIVGKYVRRSWLFNWMASFMEPRKLLLLLAVVPIFILSIYEAGTLTKLIRKEIKSKSGEAEASAGKTQETHDEKVARLKREAIEEFLNKRKAEKLDIKWIGETDTLAADGEAAGKTSEASETAADDAGKINQSDDSSETSADSNVVWLMADDEDEEDEAEDTDAGNADDKADGSNVYIKADAGNTDDKSCDGDVDDDVDDSPEDAKSEIGDKADSNSDKNKNDNDI